MKRGCSHPTADNQPWMKHDGWWQRWDGRNSNSWVIVDNFTLRAQSSWQRSADRHHSWSLYCLLDLIAPNESWVRGQRLKPSAGPKQTIKIQIFMGFRLSDNLDPIHQKKLSWRVFVTPHKNLYIRRGDWLNSMADSRAMLSDKERYQCLKKVQVFVLNINDLYSCNKW